MAKDAGQTGWLNTSICKALLSASNKGVAAQKWRHPAHALFGPAYLANTLMIESLKVRVRKLRTVRWQLAVCNTGESTGSGPPDANLQLQNHSECG